MLEALALYNIARRRAATTGKLALIAVGERIEMKLVMPPPYPSSLQLASSESTP
jgi:hypothetical protein